MARVLVAGGSGFMGSHLADALTAAGHDTVVFDRVASPFLQPGQEFVEGDIRDLDALVAAAEGCTYVYNYAGIADIGEASDAPVDTATFNVLGAVNVMEAARRAGAERYLFASTVYVFSESGSFYRASKQAAERFTEAYNDRYGLEYTILRYGSLYGPRADARNAIYRMIERALTERRIVFSGPREARRDYIHVHDAARLSIQALQPEFANTHLVLTGQESLPVNDVMTMLAEIVPGEIEVSFDDDHKDTRYVMTPYAYNPRIGTRLTSNTFVDLGQGLMACIDEVQRRISDGSEDGRAYEASLGGDS